MKRFRRARRRRAALALFPAAVILSLTMSGPSMAAQATASKFDASKSKVRTGAKVKLRGKFPPRTEGADPTPLAGAESNTSNSRQVRIQFRPAGEKNWRPAKTTTADRKGRYAKKIRVKRSGRFRAVHADGRRSAPERIRVKAKLNSRIGDKSAKVGEKVPVKGQVVPRGTQRKVVVKIGGDRLRTTTRKNGRFKVKWKADGVGNYKARVKVKGDKIAAGNKDFAGRTTVYRPAEASYYGPGFYGNRTACGQTLTPSMIGVAHKSMPCGTKLKLRYGNRTVKAKVIDRGPYAGNREFDLTEATKNKLGFPSTGKVYVNK